MTLVWLWMHEGSKSHQWTAHNQVQYGIGEPRGSLRQLVVWQTTFWHFTISSSHNLNQQRFRSVEHKPSNFEVAKMGNGNSGGFMTYCSRHEPNPLQKSPVFCRLKTSHCFELFQSVDLLSCALTAVVALSAD